MRNNLLQSKAESHVILTHDVFNHAGVIDHVGILLLGAWCYSYRALRSLQLPMVVRAKVRGTFPPSFKKFYNGII